MWRSAMIKRIVEMGKEDRRFVHVLETVLREMIGGSG